MQILSKYSLKKIDYEFLYFFDKYISKYPFKCYNLMNIFNNIEFVYIKDTTMIIDLIKIKDDNILNIFDLLKEMLRSNIIGRIIHKKEVLIVYFKNEFVISFFKEVNKWLVIPLVKIFIDLNFEFYFDVYVKNNIDKFMLLVVYNGYHISIDKKYINKLSENHIPLVISFYNNNNQNLMFSFDKTIFLENFYHKVKVN